MIPTEIPQTSSEAVDKTAVGSERYESTSLEG